VHTSILIILVYRRCGTVRRITHNWKCDGNSQTGDTGMSVASFSTTSSRAVLTRRSSLPDCRITQNWKCDGDSQTGDTGMSVASFSTTSSRRLWGVGVLTRRSSDVYDIYSHARQKRTDPLLCSFTHQMDAGSRH